MTITVLEAPKWIAPFVEPHAVDWAHAADLVGEWERNPHMFARRYNRMLRKRMDQLVSGHRQAVVGPGNRAGRRQWHDHPTRKNAEQRMRHGRLEVRRKRS